MVMTSARPSRAWLKRPAIVDYGVPIVGVGITVFIARWLDVHLQAAPVSLFVCAVMFSGWFGGYRPGLLAAVLSILAFDYYFVRPINAWRPEIDEIPRLGVFALAAFFVGSLSARQRSATETLRERTGELQRANEQLRDESVERKRAEDARRTAEAELAHVTRVTTLGEVTASFAHELNQPLAAIVNNAHTCLAVLADDRPDLSEVRLALADITNDADRASAIIERVRALASRSPAEKTLLHLEDVVKDVVALTASASAARRVTIRTHVASDLPPVLGDRVQLQQVVLNLVVNGMDAMATVGEQRRLMEIRGRRDGNDGNLAVTISVQDQGIGLDAAQIDRLFEAFYTTKPRGMGMGLAISRSIVEMHGGRLWAERNQGSGAMFSFRIPAAAVEGAES